MEDTWLAGTATLLHWLAIPQIGLGAIFVIAFISATLLPMGSEPAVFGFVKLQPELFWPAIAVATLGNTLGGAVTWWMGRAAHTATDRVRHRDRRASKGVLPPAQADAAHHRALMLLHRHGAKACLLSWLPIVGDPLCAVAGWLRLPFWPCMAYMAVGKFSRYLLLTYALLRVT